MVLASPDRNKVSIAPEKFCADVQEQRANFAIWAILKSPLMVGTDLRTLSEAALQILTAQEVIAVNQDELGVAGDLVWKCGPTEASIAVPSIAWKMCLLCYKALIPILFSQVYAGPLADGSRAVVLFNRHTSGTQYPLVNVTVQWKDIGELIAIWALHFCLLRLQQVPSHSLSSTASQAM
jgi:alpha-galactosidase